MDERISANQITTFMLLHDDQPQTIKTAFMSRHDYRPQNLKPSCRCTTTNPKNMKPTFTLLHDGQPQKHETNLYAAARLPIPKT
jgi:hypothetical protein